MGDEQFGEDDLFEPVLPFVNVWSAGGIYDDEAFVAGFEMGRLDAMLEHLTEHDDPIHKVQPTGPIPIHTPNVRQADLIAMHHGWICRFREEPGCPEWTAMWVKREM